MAEASANQNVRLVCHTDDDSVNVNNEEFHNPKKIISQMEYGKLPHEYAADDNHNQPFLIIRCHLLRRTNECGE